MSDETHARNARDSHNDTNTEAQEPVHSTGAQESTSRIESPVPQTGAGDYQLPPISSGLISLCVVAGQHQRPTDPVQLARALGLDPVAELSETQLLVAAKEIGLKARAVQSSWGRLPNNTLPAIAQLKEGGYVVLLRLDADDHVFAGDPRRQRPQRLDREQFEAIWSGKLLLIKSRLRLDNPNRPFDLSWFIPAIWKYRKILGEILAASFVIQLFGLATPLFTQVIIDKVLMHKSLSTLHVLAAGMLIMIVWATVGQISIVATAPGKFIPDGRVKELQPLEASIVKVIHVREGQRVQAGDLLLELDPTLSAAELAANADKYGFNKLEQARLNAELSNGRAHYTNADQPAARVALEERMRTARLQAHAAKLAEAKAAVEEKTAALAAAQAILKKYEETTVIVAERTTARGHWRDLAHGLSTARGRSGAEPKRPGSPAEDGPTVRCRGPGRGALSRTGRTRSGSRYL